MRGIGLSGYPDISKKWGLVGSITTSNTSHNRDSGGLFIQKWIKQSLGSDRLHYLVEGTRNGEPHEYSRNLVGMYLPDFLCL